MTGRAALSRALLALAATGCAKSLSSLAPFPCADDGSCPPEFFCSAGSCFACNPGQCSATETCPPGCTLSADGTSCLPQSPSAGAGTRCLGDGDCCTGSCVSGICTPNAGGGSSGGGSSGGSSVSSSGGGSTGGSHTASGSTGGCSAAAIDPSEFVACADAGAVNHGCGTGLACRLDPDFGDDRCEYTCADTAACPDPATACASGFCTVNLCGPNTTNGGNDGTCNAAGIGDGTCIPVVVPDAGNLYSFCFQNGSAAAGETCNQLAVRCGGAAALCGPGPAFCFIQAAGETTGTCYETCNPNGANSCPGGAACKGTDNGYTGVCE